MRVSLMSIDGQESEMGTGVRPNAERRVFRSVHRRRPPRDRQPNTAAGRATATARRAATTTGRTTAMAVPRRAAATAPPLPATTTEAGRMAAAPRKQ